MHSNKDTFFIFCDYFLSKVVGSSIWRDCCTRQKVSDMATISDEAFAFLLVENYLDEWPKKKLEEYVAEASFDETTSKWKKRKVTWGNTQKEHWEHANILGGIRMVLLDLILFVRK